MDNVGLIDMGGRTYNPKLGRFLQADPFIQAPTDLQNYNRYSYSINNPTSFIDPSGYGHLKSALKSIGNAVDKAMPVIIAVTVAVVTTMMGCPQCSLEVAMATAGPINTMISGGASALFASNGDIDQFWSGAASAFLFFQVGELAQAKGWNPGSFEKSLMHGVTGGATSVARGGSFADGFIGSFVSQAFSPLVGDGSGSYVTSAILGGTVSRLTGGDFASGAISAAYGHLFNDMKHPENCVLSCGNHLTSEFAYQLTPYQEAMALQVGGYALVLFDVGNTFFGAVGPDTGIVGMGMIATSRAMLKQGRTKSIKDQALDLKKMNNNKNTVRIQTSDKKIHYDLDGTTHKGVETPHVQYSYPNTNKKTGQTFWNKDRKTVDPMTQQDIRTVRRYLERKD